MIDMLEWLIDISMASANASATGSIFLLLVGVASATRCHFVKYRAGTRTARGWAPARVASANLAQKEFGCENAAARQN